jgi:phosphomannomutase
LALLAKKSLQKNSKGLVLIDVRASKYVRKIVEENNGKWVLNRVGHSFFKKSMKEKKAVFGGEISGHYYYRLGGFVADNAIVAALHVIELVSDSGKNFSELMKDFSNSFFTSSEINSTVAEKEAKMKELEAVYKASAKKIFWLDGITVEFEDWWFNVRPSNTEPLLRLNLEANSKELLEEKLAEVLKIIRS